jgi:hypothetical protein
MNHIFKFRVRPDHPSGRVKVGVFAGSTGEFQDMPKLINLQLAGFLLFSDGEWAQLEAMLHEQDRVNVVIEYSSADPPALELEEGE